MQSWHAPNGRRKVIGLRMKRVALLFVLLWWGQTPLCLLAEGELHAHGSVGAAASSHHHAGDRAPASSAPEDAGLPGDGSCAEHCASLAQALPPPPTSSAAPPAGVLALPVQPPVMAVAPAVLWRLAGVLREPPPEPSRHSSVLRL
jgi:hypothetical protein